MTEDVTKIVNLNIVQKPGIIRKYFKIGGYAFGLTMASTMLVGTFSNSALYVNPEIFVGCAFIKSCCFIVLWPAIPFMILTKPESYFLL